jgi:hypothetical protein
MIAIFHRQVVIGGRMKSGLVVAAFGFVLLVVSAPAAHARGNDTPAARACMVKNGFTYTQWRTHTGGSPTQVAGYKACITRANAAKGLPPPDFD